MAALHLLPTTLQPEGEVTYLAPAQVEWLNTVVHFVVEDERTARRFLRRAGYTRNFDTDVTLYPIGKHTNASDYNGYLKPIGQGLDVVLMSEAGAPAVADPGGKLVAIAHERGIVVKPLVGPSSILLTLMGSGLNGQSFAFVGYLPVDKSERVKKLRLLEKHSALNSQTQVFIEAPYRNNHVLQALLETLNMDTQLCIASNLQSAEESIKTLPLYEWAKAKPDLHKIPVVFAFLAE